MTYQDQNRPLTNEQKELKEEELNMALGGANNIIGVLKKDEKSIIGVLNQGKPANNSLSWGMKTQP